MSNASKVSTPYSFRLILTWACTLFVVTFLLPFHALANELEIPANELANNANNANTQNQSTDFDYAFETTLTDPALASKLAAMQDGRTALVLAQGDTMLPEQALQAIAGSNKMIACRLDIPVTPTLSYQCEIIFDGSRFKKADINGNLNVGMGVFDDIEYLGSFVFNRSAGGASVKGSGFVHVSLYSEKALPAGSLVRLDARYSLDSFSTLNTYGLGSSFEISKTSVGLHEVSDHGRTWFEFTPGSTRSFYLCDGILTGKRDISKYIASCSVSSTAGTGIKSGGLFVYKYTGKKVSPTDWKLIADSKTGLYASPKTLVKDVDYKVSYKNNVKSGIATMTFTGIGNFKGSKLTQRFLIAPAEVKNIKLKANTSKRKVKVSWSAARAKSSGADNLWLRCYFYNAKGKVISFRSIDPVSLRTSSKTFKYPKSTKKVKAFIRTCNIVSFAGAKGETSEHKVRSIGVKKFAKLP